MPDHQLPNALQFSMQVLWLMLQSHYTLFGFITSLLTYAAVRGEAAEASSKSRATASSFKSLLDTLQHWGSEMKRTWRNWTRLRWPLFVLVFGIFMAFMDAAHRHEIESVRLALEYAATNFQAPPRTIKGDDRQQMIKHIGISRPTKVSIRAGYEPHESVAFAEDLLLTLQEAGWLAKDAKVEYYSNRVGDPKWGVLININPGIKKGEAITLKEKEPSILLNDALLNLGYEASIRTISGVPEGEVIVEIFPQRH